MPEMSSLPYRDFIKRMRGDFNKTFEHIFSKFLNKNSEKMFSEFLSPDVDVDEFSVVRKSAKDDAIHDIKFCIFIAYDKKFPKNWEEDYPWNNKDYPNFNGKFTKDHIINGREWANEHCNKKSEVKRMLRVFSVKL